MGSMRATIGKVFLGAALLISLVLGTYTDKPRDSGEEGMKKREPIGAVGWDRSPFPEAPRLVFGTFNGGEWLKEEEPTQETQVEIKPPAQTALVDEKPLPQLRDLENRTQNVALAAPSLEEYGHFIKVGGGKPSVTAQGVLVGDLLSDEVYFSLSSSRRWPMASITKLMTAVLAKKEMEAKKEITISSGDFLPGDTTQNNRLGVGSTYTVSDLLKAMMVFSNNESAEALASYYGRMNFIAHMNRLALEWGMEDTNFDDPTGLSSSNQSTPADLERLARRVYNYYPEVLALTRLPEAKLEDLTSGKVLEFKNINTLVSNPAFLGGKTGYTDEAGGNLLTIINYGGRPIFFVVLGSSDRFADTELLMAWFGKNFKRGE